MTDAAVVAIPALGDRYTIERVLGTGGMATVHLAEEHKHQRKVAIKVQSEPRFGALVERMKFDNELS